MTITLNRLFAAMLLLLLPATLVAQGERPAPAGLRAETIADLRDINDKMTKLGYMIPSDRYSTHPAPEASTVEEIVTRTSEIYERGTMLFGGRMLDGIKRNTKDKAFVVDRLKLSFVSLRKAIENIEDADLQRTWGSGADRRTGERHLIEIRGQLHEQLGALIAYARIAGITPPWSDPAPARAAR